MADARAALEQSKEGRHFLNLVGKCADDALKTELIVAGARLLTVGTRGKENALPVFDIKSSFLSLKGLSFINPRGKFDLSFSRDALCLANAKGNIIVPTGLLTHVAILDQIPQDSKKRCLMFMVLDRNGAPVMNGKQRLEVIIIQTLETDTMSATTSNGEVLDGPVVAVLCQAVGMCIPNFTNFMAPEPEKYKSARGHAAVSAVAKVNSGHLFPLPKALVFVERPAIFVPHSDILAVEFRRPQSVTFDLVLHTAPREAPGESGAGGSIQKVEFSQIDKGEMGRLQSYFANSKIKLYDPVAPPRLGNGGGAAGATAGGGAGGAGPSHGAAEVEQIGEDDDDDNDDDDDDEDFDPSLPEHLISGHPPAKRPRTDPSGSGAGPSNASGAGPSSGRCDVDMGEEEEEDEEDEESEDEESEGEDDEDELADLTDEDDLRADDVRQRVRHGDGMHATDGGRRAHLKRPRSDDDVEDEEEEDEDEDEEEED